MVIRGFRYVRRFSIKRLLLWAVALFVSLVVFGRYIEPQWIQVTQHDVEMPGLPSSLDGFKVVQISDIHRGSRTKDITIEKAVRLANEQSPDIIVLTGDFINRPADNAEPCAEMLSHLKPRIATFAVFGNHDHWTDAARVRGDMESKGIRFLNNENLEVARGLFIIGIDDVWAGEPDVARAWSGVRKTTGQLLLSHTPMSAPLFADRRCVALTGHTHGGEVKIPFVPRSSLPGLRGCPYIQGWYQVGNARVYVNRGIGIVNPAKVRFLSRPEIAVFHLHSPKPKNSD